MARSISKRSASRNNRHSQPLADEIASIGLLSAKSKKRKTKHDEEDEEARYVDSKLSRKILKIGQDLADEESDDIDTPKPNPAFTFDSRVATEPVSDDEGPEMEDDAWSDEEDEFVEEVEISPGDLELFNKFMPNEPDPLIQASSDSEATSGQGRNLADIILAKIAAHEAAQARAPIIQGGGLPEDAVEIPAKVVEVYSKIGLLLSRYKSGKLPKPFKILPTLPQWEDLLSITKPASWSPNACYEATRVFVSSKPHVTQRFLETVILDRVREDIHETKKLNVHLYNALKKGLYKPAAFFKGFLFPLVSSGSCTLREAHIISSVLVKIKIPVLHSAAALMRLTELAAEQTSVASSESAGATNIFIRVLLEKKYALPYKVIDSLVFHFLRFRVVPTPTLTPTLNPKNHHNSPPPTTSNALALHETKLPVLWHQCLLAFAQRYRNDITEDQREALLDLLIGRAHKDIGPEVRRELLEGRGRGVVLNADGDGNGDGRGDGREGGDDTMVMDVDGDGDVVGR